jgi:hypothetical protein
MTIRNDCCHPYAVVLRPTRVERVDHVTARGVDEATSLGVFAASRGRVAGANNGGTKSPVSGWSVEAIASFGRELGCPR